VSCVRFQLRRIGDAATNANVTLRSIGGLLPPFLVGKNADAERRLRAIASGRLEGWPQTRSLLPPFETRAFGALLRVTAEFVARSLRKRPAR